MTDKKSPVEVFTAMAERIARNDPKEFQGAYIIIAPDGKIISHLFVDLEGDENSFWGFVASAVQIASTEAQVRAEDKIRMMGMGMPQRSR